MKMKKILAIIIAIVMFCLFCCSCAVNDSEAGTTPDEKTVPEIVAKTNGGEKWETKIDYSDENNWLAIEDNGKDVDLIYFYPTTFNKASDDAPEIADITDEGMRSGAQQVYEKQATVFEEDCNIYAPFYRQVSAPYTLSMTPEDNVEFMYYSASCDPSEALDYYFENYNNGKPFILAGHSQGSQILTGILANYMKEHPDYYKNMVAAYIIGYSVTEEYMEENPHLKFAECADDVGVIISYNTEGPENKGKHNSVVRDGAISINPLNWKRDDTKATVSENLGSINASGEIGEGIADATIDLERGVVVCESVDPSVYAVGAPGDKLFGPESYHSFDYGFYYMNLRENAKVRIEAFAK